MHWQTECPPCGQLVATEVFNMARGAGTRALIAIAIAIDHRSSRACISRARSLRAGVRVNICIEMVSGFSDDDVDGDVVLHFRLPQRLVDSKRTNEH